MNRVTLTIPIRQIDPETNKVVREYPSLDAAVAVSGIDRSTLYSVLDRKGYKNGFVWERIQRAIPVWLSVDYSPPPNDTYILCSDGDSVWYGTSESAQFRPFAFWMSLPPAPNGRETKP